MQQQEINMYKQWLKQCAIGDGQPRARPSRLSQADRQIMQNDPYEVPAANLEGGAPFVMDITGCHYVEDPHEDLVTFTYTVDADGEVQP